MTHNKAGSIIEKPEFAFTVAYDGISGVHRTQIINYTAAEMQAAGEGKTTEEYLRGRIESSGLNRRSYDETGFVSDMVDAASDGAVRFSGGHTYSDADYWHHAGAVQREFFANYGGSAVCNPVEYGLMRELFPSSCGTMDEIIEAMANA